MISAAKSPEETFRVPLEYDARISTLLKKLELLYDEFEQLMSKHGASASPDTLSSVQAARVHVPNKLGGLPNVLGLVVTRLCQAHLAMTDVYITTTASRFIELVLTQQISTLASLQFASDPAKILTQYEGLGSLQEYVAKTDEIPVSNLVSYRIAFSGDSEERIIYVPMNYGRRTLLVYQEFKEKGAGYIPPIPFMTGYAFPQMFMWHWNEPNNWNIEWKCESVFVKNFKGDYLDEDGIAW